MNIIHKVFITSQELLIHHYQFLPQLYQLMFHQVDRVADKRTLRGLLSQLTSEQVEQIRQVNEALLDLKADLDGPREVWLDFDDTVITVFGNQKGSEVGYKSRYHGRASYKAKVAFISRGSELVHANLSGGKTASNVGFLACAYALPNKFSSACRRSEY